MEQPVEAAGREVHVIEWSAKRREFAINAGSETEARFQTFYYPYWQATADGKQLMTKPADDGALLVSLPQTATTVKVDFVEPTSTYTAGIVSVLACWGFRWRSRFHSVSASLDRSARNLKENKFKGWV